MLVVPNTNLFLKDPKHGLIDWCENGTDTSKAPCQQTYQIGVHLKKTRISLVEKLLLSLFFSCSTDSN